MGCTSICRASAGCCKRWDCRVKKSLHATERDRKKVGEARLAYWQEIAQYPSERLRFIDESGVNIALTRAFGRAPPGERIQDAVPKNHGKNITVLGALSPRGIDAVMTVEGATDAAVFRVYVEKVLLPTLAPGEVVVMDNLGAHKVKGIREAIEGAGGQLIYLPPYSPDFSPIENSWSKLKTALRAAKARTRDTRDQALKHALDTITTADARAWFIHCGYALH